MILCEGLPIIGFFFFLSLPVLLAKSLIQCIRKRYRQQKLEHEQRARFEELERINRECDEAMQLAAFIREDSKKRSEDARKFLEESRRIMEERNLKLHSN